MTTTNLRSPAEFLVVGSTVGSVVKIMKLHLLHRSLKSLGTACCSQGFTLDHAKNQHCPDAFWLWLLRGSKSKFVWNSACVLHKPIEDHAVSGWSSVSGPSEQQSLPRTSTPAPQLFPPTLHGGHNVPESSTCDEPKKRSKLGPSVISIVTPLVMETMMAVAAVKKYTGSHNSSCWTAEEP